MLSVVEIRFDARKLSAIQRKFEKTLPRGLGTMNLKVAKIIAKSLQYETLNDRYGVVSSERFKASRQIRAVEFSKTNTSGNVRDVAGVMVPESLIMLDSMRPHYVALYRSRPIDKWVSKHFGSARLTGLSHVNTGYKGIVQKQTASKYKRYSRGNLFVTPRPFIRRGIWLAKRPWENYIRKQIKYMIETVGYY